VQKEVEEMKHIFTMRITDVTVFGITEKRSRPSVQVTLDMGDSKAEFDKVSIIQYVKSHITFNFFGHDARKFIEFYGMKPSGMFKFSQTINSFGTSTTPLRPDFELELKSGDCECGGNGIYVDCSYVCKVCGVLLK
jgi:hypothetical protein